MVINTINRRNVDRQRLATGGKIGISTVTFMNADHQFKHTCSSITFPVHQLLLHSFHHALIHLILHSFVPSILFSQNYPIFAPVTRRAYIVIDVHPIY